ncbi:hypothetical protein WAI453_007442 [Rhynchosporium graminicola]
MLNIKDGVKQCSALQLQGTMHLSERNALMLQTLHVLVSDRFERLDDRVGFFDLTRGCDHVEEDTGHVSDTWHGDVPIRNQEPKAWLFSCSSKTALEDFGKIHGSTLHNRPFQNVVAAL